MPLTDEEQNELFHEFLRRLAEQLYPVADAYSTDFQRARFYHEDLQGWSKADIEKDLEVLRIRRRMIDHQWLEEREVALQERLSARRRRRQPAQPRRSRKSTR